MNLKRIIPHISKLHCKNTIISKAGFNIIGQRNKT